MAGLEEWEGWKNTFSGNEIEVPVVLVTLTEMFAMIRIFDDYSG